MDGIDERRSERGVKLGKICIDCRVFRPSPGYNLVDNPSITNSRGCTALCGRLGSFCRFVWGAATSRKSQSPNRKSICAAVRVLLVATTLQLVVLGYPGYQLLQVGYISHWLPSFPLLGYFTCLSFPGNCLGYYKLQNGCRINGCRCSNLSQSG